MIVDTDPGQDEAPEIARRLSAPFSMRKHGGSGAALHGQTIIASLPDPTLIAGRTLDAIDRNTR